MCLLQSINHNDDKQMRRFRLLVKQRLLELLEFNRHSKIELVDKQNRKIYITYQYVVDFEHYKNILQSYDKCITLTQKPSRQQSQVEMRIAILTTDNDHFIQESTKNQELIIKDYQKPKEFQNKLIIHYTHEKRFNTRKRDMHRIFQDTFANTSNNRNQTDRWEHKWQKHNERTDSKAPTTGNTEKQS
ncbi:unnamed protein product [Rotaria socialis]|uniref:Uncharacterized protein n=2 Tax=Rotaria socialis TaxID=392032 RepID=A0A821DSL0_9BILA|nr:unnamed protein product [Rotaria socialis]